MSKVQINISIPEAWKENLDTLVTSNVSCADLIREAISEKYGFNESITATNFPDFVKENFTTITSWNYACPDEKPFILEPFQEGFIKHIEDHKFTIATKFRQAGFSTLTLLWGLWECLNKPNLRVLYVCKRETDAIYLSRILDHYLNQMPNKVSLTRNSRFEKSFAKTGSKMWFHGPEPARGKACSHIIIDEAAFFKDLERVWKFLFPSVVQADKVIISSTQKNGGWVYFDDLLRDAEEGKNSFKVYHSLYTDSSRYADPEKNAEMRKLMGETTWLQEIEQCKLLNVHETE
jgi:hypothetical protein